MSHSVSSVAPTIEVAGEKESIFRSKALRSYSDREQQSASYTLVTPRSLYLLWALLVLVVFFGVITWLSEIPVYTTAALKTHTVKAGLRLRAASNRRIDIQLQLSLRRRSFQR